MDDFKRFTKFINTPNPLLSMDRLRMKLGGRSRSSIYRDVQAGRLPIPIKRGATLSWREDEVDAAMQRLRATDPSTT